MKYSILLPGLALIISFNRPPHRDSFFGLVTMDTSHITHTMDGITNEWPDSLFQTDRETSIRYAADNNDACLFFALRIADFRTQMKLMRQGMNLFIDLKGKKKENRSIEFPLKPQSGEGYSGSGMNNQQGNGQQGKFDKQAFRETMAIRLLGMKLIGFSDDESSTQGLSLEGSANISFSWDSSDVMHIEYKVPFNLFGEAASLNQKTISIGWKINGIDPGSANNSPAYTTTSIQGRPSGNGGPRGNTRGAGSSSDPFVQAGSQKPVGEQSFWGKYTVHL